MTEPRLIIDRSLAHLGTATFVIGFRKPDADMRLKQATVESSFRTLIDSQSTQTNVPDKFDPSAPRFVLSSGNKSIFVSQVACQLTMNFPESGTKNLDEQWDIIVKNVRSFERAVLKLKDASEVDVSSLVLGIECVSNASSAEISKYIAERFLCRPVDDSVASVQIVLGYKRGDFFVNINASAYERVDIEVPAGSAGLFVNVAKIPVSGRGVALQLDINNRLRFLENQDAPYASLDPLLEMSKAWTQEQFEKMFS